MNGLSTPIASARRLAFYSNSIEHLKNGESRNKNPSTFKPDELARNAGADPDTVAEAAARTLSAG